jgi:hypothetical protein
MFPKPFINKVDVTPEVAVAIGGRHLVAIHTVWRRRCDSFHGGEPLAVPPLPLDKPKRDNSAKRMIQVFGLVRDFGHPVGMGTRATAERLPLVTRRLCPVRT